MSRRVAVLSGLVAGLIGLLVHASEARALPYVIRDDFRTTLAWMTGQIETAGVLADGETLAITSLNASGTLLQPMPCTDTLCPDGFFSLVLSIELDPAQSSELTLREAEGLLRVQGAVHLLVTASGATTAATLDVEEESVLFGEVIGGLDLSSAGQIRGLPNFASAGLLVFDGLLHFSTDPGGLLSGLYGLGFSAVPEPSTGVLAVLGVATLAWRQRKRPTRATG